MTFDNKPKSGDRGVVRVREMIVQLLFTVARQRRASRFLAVMAGFSTLAGGCHACAQTVTSPPPTQTDPLPPPTIAPEVLWAMTHPPHKGGPTPPVPTGPPAKWIGDDDYPRTALANHVAGIVRFALTVAANGIPTACEITGSSNDAELDSATCLLVSKRAQFFPAKDANGKPVEGVFRSSVRWQLPDIALPVTGQMTVAFDVLPDGSMANCFARATGDMLAKLPRSDPQVMCTKRTFVAPLDDHGQPVKRHYVFETKVSGLDVP